MNNELIFITALATLALIISIWTAWKVFEWMQFSVHTFSDVRALEREVENLSNISRGATTDSGEDTTKETTNISP